MKTTRILTMLALLLMAGGVTMQAQEYESYFGTDSTRLNVLQYCIDWVSTGYMEINTADTPEDSFLKMQSYISAKKPRREDYIAISP